MLNPIEYILLCDKWYFLKWSSEMSSVVLYNSDE